MWSSIQTMQNRKQHFNNEMVLFKSNLNNSTNNLPDIILLNTLNCNSYHLMKAAKEIKLRHLLPSTWHFQAPDTSKHLHQCYEKNV